jgi:hypothetical protein
MSKDEQRSKTVPFFRVYPWILVFGVSLIAGMVWLDRWAFQ